MIDFRPGSFWAFTVSFTVAVQYVHVIAMMMMMMMETNHGSESSAQRSSENNGLGGWVGTYEPDERDAVLPGRVFREQSTRGRLCDDGDAFNAG